MVLQYKKYGVTTGGYRGERAVLEERVIEGLEEPTFEDSVLRLTDTDPQTIYLNDNNTSTGYFIVLPNAQTLWNNWRVSIVNESSVDVNIYYYTDDLEQLSFYKEVTSGNMSTLILLDNTSIAGTWTTLRTTEQSNADLLNKYTSDVYEPLEITWNELKQDTTTITVPIGSVLAGTAVKSVYIKTTEQFSGMTSISVTVGTQTDTDRFSTSYDLSQAVSDTNFTKDVFDEILSNSSDTMLYATFTGTGLNNLTAGSVNIVVEKARLIDPTVLKNPILQTQVPIGVIMNYAFNDVPSGYWRLDGSLFPNAATSIPEFVQKLTAVNNQLTNKIIITESQWQSIKNTYGSCGKFAWNGSALRFPLITNFIQGLNDLSTLGAIVEAGLPNISGYVDIYKLGYNGTGSSSGALSLSAGSYAGSGAKEVGNNLRINFNASRSNSVYGNANTVQPQSVRYPYIISIFNTFQNSASIDLDALIESSVLKANTSLDNLVDTGLSVIKNTVIPTWNRSGNGFIKLKPNSGVPIIIQWGMTGNFTGSSDVNTYTQSLPTPFTSNSYRVAITPFVSARAAGNKRDFFWADNYTTTTFQIHASWEYNTTANFTWIAIGY